ncbi:MAG: hypothetical protein M3328_16420, partial [Chloroflexota bacterium]|nr:hypothetical protein [Chloroflexota bacterium]
MNTYWRKFAFSAMLTSMMGVLVMALLVGGARLSYGAASAALAGQSSNGNSAGLPAEAKVTTDSDAARDKLSPALREATGKVWVTIFHQASAGAALHKIEPNLYQRAYTLPDGSTLSIGEVDAAKLVKLASVDGVERIADYTDAQPDVITPEGPVKARGTTSLLAKGAQWQQQRANGAKLVPTDNKKPNQASGSSPNAPEDWYDISDGGHRASQAWANGYDGTGVRVGVLDTGVDFGHPDLFGMYAIYPSGVYSGWPYAWSDKSVAYWEILGEASTPENYDWSESGLNTFVDTSRTLTAPMGVTTTAVITIPKPDFTNGGSTTITHTYTLPKNSKSGVVHVGFHPDPSANWLNYPELSQPALVVVDVNTAGVYDTVYVDYDNDHNFNNDEPFSKSNTTASYDVDADGIADFSGGLLYWIADGTNPVPGSYIWVDEPNVPGAGNLVAFMFDTDVFVSSHGTHCASNVVGQGVIYGDEIDGQPVAPW